MQLLERIKKFNELWVRKGFRRGNNANNVSATVSIDDKDWERVGQWMWENKASYNGLSVLPFDSGNYKQAPFEDISETQFKELEKSLKAINLTDVVEMDDHTDHKAEAACAGGECQVV